MSLGVGGAQWEPLGLGGGHWSSVGEQWDPVGNQWCSVRLSGGQCVMYIHLSSPVDTRRKLNVHKTVRKTIRMSSGTSYVSLITSCVQVGI